MVHGSIHGFFHGFVLDFVHGLVYGLVHGFVCGTQFMVHGVRRIVLLEDGILPFIVHLNFGHLPDTQRYLGLLSEPCSPTQTF